MAINQKVSREVSPSPSAAAVTPSDTVVFDPPGRALYVGATGDVAVRMAGGAQSVTFVNVQGGSIISIAVDMVKSTATTASSIVVLY